MRRFAVSFAFILASASGLVVTSPSTAGASATCVYESSKGQVVVEILVAFPTSGTTLSVGPNSEILVDGSSCVSSGGVEATLQNASLISVNSEAVISSAPDTLTIDLSGGRFGSIGWVVDFNNDISRDTIHVIDGVDVFGSDENTIVFGSVGFAIGGSTGTYTAVDEVVLEGRGGPDFLSAAGGTTVTGGPFTGDADLLGGDGHDRMFGGPGHDSFVGGSGRDLVSYEGRTENLELSADGLPFDGAPGEYDDIEADVEALLGGSGNDVIEMPTSVAFGPGSFVYCSFSNVNSEPDACGGPGNDNFPNPDATPLGTEPGGYVSGGPGADTADWSASNLGGVFVGADVDFPTAHVEDDVETLIGSRFRDVLHTGEGPQTLMGGDGDDHLDGGLGADVFIGGDGNDTVSYSSHGVGVVATLNGLPDDGIFREDFIHDDVENLEGGGGGDRLTGNGFANLLVGGGGMDVLNGGGGNDTLRGNEEDDELHGGDEADDLGGGFGSDSLFGDEGRDTLRGAEDDDDLHGGLGNDVLDGGPGPDVMAGDEGKDKVTYEDRMARVVVTLRQGDNDGEAGEHDNVDRTVEVVIGGEGNDEFVSASRGPIATIFADNVFVGNGGDDTLKGGGGNDTLDGGSGEDTLRGGQGHDLLFGNEGGDDLQGEDGNDRLYGGPHVDTLKGNSGADTIFAAGDGYADYVRGGNGNDECHVDANDDVTGC